MSNAKTIFVENFNHASDEHKVRGTIPGCAVVSSVIPNELGDTFAIECAGHGIIGTGCTAREAWEDAYERNFDEIWNRIFANDCIRELPA